MQRRLAAILAADVVGYSRLMGADEFGTLASLKSHRRELVDSGIAEHHGRIVKTTGDGMLVEFASVVDAVGCAVNVQRGMVRRNVSIPPEKQIVFRIGINVGDIIIDGGDIFGDGCPSGNPVRSWRHMHLEGGKRPDQGQALDVFRRPR
jgi:class 3 adenylate cyclase